MLVLDQVREVVALAQLLPQVHVLVDEPLALGFDQLLHLQRLADHRGDDAEELRRAVVEALRLERQLNSQRARGTPVQQDRDGDEAAVSRLAAIAELRLQQGS